MGVVPLAGGGCGWNLWVWLVGVVIRRYIDFLILLIPTPLVSALFCSSIPTFCSFLTLGAHAQRGLLYLVRVCVCVCLSAPFRPLRVKVSPENDTNASSRQDKDIKTGDCHKNAPFKSYGVICSLCRRSAVL